MEVAEVRGIEMVLVVKIESFRKILEVEEMMIIWVEDEVLEVEEVVEIVENEAMEAERLKLDGVASREQKKKCKL